MSFDRKKTIIAGIVVLLIVVFVWRMTRPEYVPVILHTIDYGTVESSVANTRAGTVKACQRAHIAPAVGGQVAVLNVTEGDKVKAGQVLLELWNDDRRAEITLAANESRRAQAQAEEACLVAEVAEREARRQVSLKKKGLTSEELADKAVTEARARAAGCRAAKASATVSHAREAVALAAMDRTILKAPFDGIVAEVNAEVAEFVTPSPPGIPTPPAIDLIASHCPYVVAPIDEVDAPGIRPGMTARITLDAFAKQPFMGTVKRVAPYVIDREKQARTVDVEVSFNDSEGNSRFLPGYSADIEIILQVHTKVLRIPSEAVLEGERVLVYRDNGLLEERAITRGISNWKFTEVTAGLKQGERIVLSVERKGVEAGAYARPEKAQP